MNMWSMHNVCFMYIIKVQITAIDAHNSQIMYYFLYNTKIDVLFMLKKGVSGDLLGQMRPKTAR